MPHSQHDKQNDIDESGPWDNERWANLSPSESKQIVYLVHMTPYLNFAVYSLCRLDALLSREMVKKATRSAVPKALRQEIQGKVFLTINGHSRWCVRIHLCKK